MIGRMRRTVSVIAVVGVSLVLPIAGSAMLTGASEPRAAAVDPPEQARAAARRYVVRLADPPLAGYTGFVPEASAESAESSAPSIGDKAPAAGPPRRGVHLDLEHPAARAYVARLLAGQDRVIRMIRAIAPDARVDWRYRYVLNGFAVKITPDEAFGVMHLPGVAAVDAAEFLQPEMDSTVPLIGAPSAWEAVGGAVEAGLGVRIAIVDTGIDSNHPFMRDEGMPAPPADYPAATMHLRGEGADGRVLNYPEPARFVNGKVIAARAFPSPEMVEGMSDDALLSTFKPFSGGHGLHVAGIAAGRQTTAVLPTFWGQTASIPVAGVAPMAWVLNYKYDFTDAPGGNYTTGANVAATPELIAMLDQMVLDEVDVLNLSEGHVTFLIDHPSEHPLAKAFDGAAGAGIVVVVSAGNSGANGRTSLSGGFKYSDKILAVANTTTTSSTDIRVEVVGTGAPAPELVAAPRGNIAITQTIAAPLVLAPDGGCQVAPGAAGAIVVAVAVGEGTCSYAERAQVQKTAGAAAILYAYNNRVLGGTSTTPVVLPAVAVGTRGGSALVEWLGSGPADARATIQPGVLRGYNAVPDLLAPSSAQGPGIDWSIKPDIAAPGTSIVSSMSSVVGSTVTPRFASSSGTSMSAPHVAGAAGLIRSAHPDWSAERIRSTLINTANRSVAVSQGATSRPANPTEGGPGRLDLTHALDPGAFLTPATASFGKIEAGATNERGIRVTSTLAANSRWTVAVERGGGDGRVTVSGSELDVRPNSSAVLTVALDTTGLTESEHWGDVVLRETGSDRVLRLPYFAYVDTPSQHKDVLLVNWTMGNTPDYGKFYTDALDAAGLTYDVWWVDEAPASTAAGAVQAHPPFEVMQRHDLVILNTNMSRVGLQQPFAGSYQYFNHLLAGGNLLVAGQGPQGWWTVGNRPQDQQGASQNQGCDMCLARYMAGYQFGITATLSNRLLVWPEKPDEPEMVVEIHPHTDGNSAFGYSLDLSTGKLAKDGAAGNQYRFASGGLLGDYDPAREYPYTERVYDRVRPYARPLWAYGDRVVGTYISGRQNPVENIPWNAMYWGFGLEGVGKGGAATVDRVRLLGDTFNFLAHGLWVARVRVTAPTPASRRLALELPQGADMPLIKRVEVDWGDGQSVDLYDPPVPVYQLDLTHRYGQEGSFDVHLRAIPAVGAAPLVAEVRVEGVVVGRASASYLPWVGNGP